MKKIIDVCYSVDNPFFSTSYESCKVMADGTLSFESDDNRSGGGSFLNRSWYKNFGETYEEAVEKYLASIKKSNPAYHARIKEMLSRNGLSAKD